GGRGDRERRRQRGRAEHHGAAQQVDHDRSDLGGEPEGGLRARVDCVADQHDRDGEHAAGHEDRRCREPQREPRRDRAGLGQQDEGAQARGTALGLLGLLLLALDADQRADRERDREVPQRGEQLAVVHRACMLACVPRALPNAKDGTLARRRLAGLVFLTVVLAVGVGMHVYLAERLVLAPAWPTAVREICVAALGLAFAAVFARFFLRRRVGALWTALSWGAYSWLGLAFLLVMITLARDVVLGLVGAALPSGAHPSDLLVLARGRALVVGAVGLAAGAIALREGLAPPRLRRIEIPLARWPRALDGFRIAQISDLH